MGQLFPLGLWEPLAKYVVFRVLQSAEYPKMLDNAISRRTRRFLIALTDYGPGLYDFMPKVTVFGGLALFGSTGDVRLKWSRESGQRANVYPEPTGGRVAKVVEI